MHISLRQISTCSARQFIETEGNEWELYPELECRKRLAVVRVISVNAPRRTGRPLVY